MKWTAVQLIFAEVIVDIVGETLDLRAVQHLHFVPHRTSVRVRSICLVSFSRAQNINKKL